MLNDIICGYYSNWICLWLNYDIFIEKKIKYVKYELKKLKLSLGLLVSLLNKSVWIKCVLYTLT